MSSLFSIRSKLILFFLIIMVVPSLLITTVMYRRSTELLREKKGDSIINELLQTSRILDGILTHAENQLTSFMVEPENYLYLKNLAEAPAFDEDFSRDVWRRLSYTCKSSRGIESIYIYLSQKKLLFTSYELRKMTKVADPNNYPWLTIPVDRESNSSGWRLSVSIPPTVSELGVYVFLLKKMLKNIRIKEPIGEICISVDERYIRYNLLDGVWEGMATGILLLDGEGRVLSAKSRGMIGKKLKDLPYVQRVLQGREGTFLTTVDDRKMLVGYVTSDYTGWKYLLMIPSDSLSLNVSEIKRLALWVNILSSLLVILLAVFFSQFISRPIGILKAAMKAVEDGRLKVQIREERRDEFGILNRGFNRMITRIQRLMDELYHEKLLKKEAELKNLQAQINPHFLYNTLDLIHWMARLNKNDKVSQLAFSLSNFYRLNLGSGKDIVTVRDTIALLTEYLNIQKIRFGEKFSFEIVAEEELMGCQVLRLLIQPLVENAIYHGIEKKKGKGFIKVTVSRRAQQLEFRVEDNGVGISPEKLEQIQECLSRRETKTNFALVNIEQRIKICYGENYGLKIESHPDHGTVVRVLLPLIKENNTEERDDVQTFDCG